jgi:hypothetical protein
MISLLFHAARCPMLHRVFPLTSVKYHLIHFSSKGPSWNRVNRLVKNEVDAKSQLTSSISFSNPFTFTLHNQTEFSTKNKETNHPLEYPPPLFFSVSVNPKEEDASDRSEPPLPK